MKDENSYKYINETKQLENMCIELVENTNIIALDTEFIRKSTYYPVLCLIQINYYTKDGISKNFIVDTLNKKINLTCFYKLVLNNDKIKKVIHSFGQDIEALNYISNTKINNVDDTQVMAEFCFCDSNLSYSNLAEQILNIDFTKNKNIQVSNWKRRPLSEKQKKYAVNDVIYLIPIYKVLLEKLKNSGNYKHYLDEVNFQLNKNKKYMLKNSWKKIKFDFDNQNLNYVFLLKELCKWRENEAIRNNTIRGNIVANGVLEEIAKFRPRTQEKFKEIFTYSKYKFNLSRVQKQEILDIVNEFCKYLDPKYDNILYYTNEKHFIYKDLLNSIYEKIKKIAEKHKISMSLTINKTDIIALIMNYEDENNILYGWKKELFGDIFKDIKNNISFTSTPSP